LERSGLWNFFYSKIKIFKTGVLKTALRIT
jgi:hypothetical protein